MHKISKCETIMVLRGKIKNGKIHLSKPAPLPDGTIVEVRPVKKPSKLPKRPKAKAMPKSLAERLAPIIGMAKHRPPDMAEQHDHYLYGTPKRK